MTDAAYRAIKVLPIAGAIGAEITGVDLATDLVDETVAEIRRAWLEHLVVFFRDQDLAPEEFLAFARRIGEPVEYPFVKGIDGFPEIIAVTKLPHETVNFGGIWHSDTVYLERPPMATLLIAREVPPYGGDTMFSNMYAAYDALSPGMQRLLDGLTAVNSSALADVSKTREDRIRDSGLGDRQGVRGRASRRAHAPRDRAQGALRERRAHGSLRRHDRRREPAAVAVPVRALGAARVHVPLPVAGGFARAVGQPVRDAQPDQRLPRPHADHAPHHPRGRRAAC